MEGLSDLIKVSPFCDAEGPREKIGRVEYGFEGKRICHKDKKTVTYHYPKTACAITGASVASDSNLLPLVLTLHKCIADITATSLPSISNGGYNRNPMKRNELYCYIHKCCKYYKNSNASVYVLLLFDR